MAIVDLRDLRLAVYTEFASSGRALDVERLSATFDASPSAIANALATLADAHHVVLDADGNIVMAHPFSAVPLGFSVMGASTLWWGGCAWDSFALIHLLTAEPSLLVATTCPNCDTPHAWNLSRAAPPSEDQVAHFLTPVAHMWDDIVHTCGHQRIFCSETCVDEWLESHHQTRGYVMSLATLWSLASEWYTGRLERDYERRDPVATAAYLRRVGLSGEFWGL